VRHPVAVDFEQSEVDLVDVKGVELVGPVLDDPLFRGSCIDRDRRRIAHAVRPEHGARLALGDVKIDLILAPGARIFGQRNDPLTIRVAREETTEEIRPRALLNVGRGRERGRGRCR